MCDKKQRYLSRDEKHVKLGFRAYQMFYEINYRNVKSRSFEDFMTSKHYLDFVRFGRYLLDIKAVNAFGFIEFIMKTAIPVHKWQSPVVYETYVRELNKKESPSAALERNFLLMQEWSVETGEEWTEFFRKVQPTLATLWIRSGRISPWVLYTASSAADLLGRMSEEQINLVHQVLEPKFWQAKLDANQTEVESIREELEAAGI